MTKKDSNFAEVLKERILVLDGAMGTMIQEYELEESDFRGEIFTNHKSDLKGNNDILCLTKKQLITEIHEKYLESGCDIIETNTFNANRISQADYNAEQYCFELNKAAAKLAKEACENIQPNTNQDLLQGHWALQTKHSLSHQKSKIQDSEILASMK